MPSSGKRYYWDANVFITLISNLNTPNARADRQNVSLFIQEAMDGQIEIVTSAITIIEVLDTKENLTKPVPERIRQKVRDLFEEPYITVVIADAARAAEARELRWGYPWLRTPDALHVASAVYARVDGMHTYDGRGSKKGLIDLTGLAGC